MITYQKNNNLYMFKNIIKAFQIEKIVSLNINITKKTMQNLGPKVLVTRSETILGKIVKNFKSLFF